jgi:ribosomal protein S27AE
LHEEYTLNRLDGKRFGKLMVVRRADAPKNRYVGWECICDCGNRIVVQSSHLVSGQTKSCGCLRNEIRSIKSRANTGNKNPNWKGGISKDNYHYKKLQKGRYPERIKARQIAYEAIKTGKLIKQPCEKCGKIDVDAHHDDYSKPLEVRWLCEKHHREESGGKY